MLSVTALLLTSAALAGARIGSIRSLSLDTGLSTLRSVEIAIEEINAAGGMSGEKLVPVNADIGEDIIGGAKAHEYLAETGEANLIISGPIDDASLGWSPRIQKFQIPMLDTRTSCIGIIDMVAEDPETMVSYFMNIASDEALAALHIDFGAGVLKKEMGWGSVTILAEDTAFDEAITGLVAGALGPVAGAGAKEIIIYNISTVDFVSLSPKA